MLKVEDSIDYIYLVNDQLVFGKDFKLIPPKTFSSVLDLIIYLAKKELEVLFYLNYDLNNNYVFTIPSQKIGKYRIEVIRDKNYRELSLSGQVIQQPLIRLGSLHSHHKLEAVFSIEDDLSDFNSPPGLHILVGEFPNLIIKSSFVLNQMRYYVNPISVLDYHYLHCYQENKVKELYKVISSNLIR